MKITRLHTLALAGLLIGIPLASWADKHTPIPVDVFTPGNTPHPPRIYLISEDKTEATDQNTGLTWRRCAEGVPLSGSCAGVAKQFTHAQALQHATDVAISTGVAWRLPNIKELATIGYTERHSDYPAIDRKTFPATPNHWFWSSTIDENDSSRAWYLSFAFGGGGSTYRSDPHFVRLVRGPVWWK